MFLHRIILLNNEVSILPNTLHKYRIGYDINTDNNLKKNTKFFNELLETKRKLPKWRYFMVILGAMIKKQCITLSKENQ